MTPHVKSVGVEPMSNRVNRGNQLIGRCVLGHRPEERVAFNMCSRQLTNPGGRMCWMSIEAWTPSINGIMRTDIYIHYVWYTTFVFVRITWPVFEATFMPKTTKHMVFEVQHLPTGLDCREEHSNRIISAEVSTRLINFAISLRTSRGSNFQITRFL